MVVLAKNHPFLVSNRNGKMKFSALKICGDLAASLHVGVYIFNPLSEKEVLIILPKE